MGGNGSSGSCAALKAAAGPGTEALALGAAALPGETRAQPAKRQAHSASAANRLTARRVLFMANLLMRQTAGFIRFGARRTSPAPA